MAFDFSKIGQEREKEKHTLYLVLSGDKGFGQDSSMIMKSTDGLDVMVSGYELYSTLLQRLISKRLNDGFDIDIRYGDNAGVDSIVERYAKEHSYICHQYKPNWEKGGAGAGYRRNEDMFLMVGMRPHKGCMLLWDGKDPYTRHLIFCAWAQSVPCKVWNYVERRWLSKEEVYDVQMDVRQEQVEHGRYF